MFSYILYIIHAYLKYFSQVFMFFFNYETTAAYLWPVIAYLRCPKMLSR